MKKKSRKAYNKQKKEFRFHDVKLVGQSGKQIRIRHPAYVFLQRGNMFIYITIAHSPNTNKMLVIKLKKNPNPKDNRDAYRVLDIREDTIDRFGKRIAGWKMNSQDDYEIRQDYKNKRKR